MLGWLRMRRFEFELEVGDANFANLGEPGGQQ